jgi:RimJ/RimL family protein N-acetyltransferase
MPSIPEPPERFGDDLVELREIAGWDIPEVLIAHQDDRDLHRRLGLEKPPSAAQLGLEVEHAEQKRLAGESVSFTIVAPGRNDCRGRVEVDGFDWGQGSAVMRVWVAPQLRDRGYEQRACDLASEWLRTVVGVQQLTVTLVT